MESISYVKHLQIITEKNPKSYMTTVNDGKGTLYSEQSNNEVNARLAHKRAKVWAMKYIKDQA